MTDNIIDSAKLEKSYDVIVIGSGIGGLVTACLLAQDGYETLILERAPFTGGLCSAFDQDGHIFDRGPVLFQGLTYDSKMPFLRKVLDELGMSLETLDCDPFYRLALPKGNVDVTRDRYEFFAQLSEVFPNQLDGIRKFYRRMDDIYSSWANLPIIPWQNLTALPELLIHHKRTLLNIVGHIRHSLADMLTSYVKSKRVRNMFDMDCLHSSMVTADEYPLLQGALLLMERHHGGFIYPAGGSQSLINAFLRAFHLHYGTLCLSTPVDIIRVRDGKADGVVLDDGKHINARCVISNASLAATFVSMMEPGFLPSKYLRKLDNTVYPPKCAIAYFGVDKSAIPEGTPANMFILGSHGNSIKEMQPLFVNINTQLDDTLAPPDCANLRIVCPFDSADSEIPDRDALYEVFVERLEKHFPSLASHIRFHLIRLPHRLEEENARPGGTYPPALTVSQSFQYRFGNKTPIRSLFLVGDNGAPGPSVLSSTINALYCYEYAVAELNPTAGMMRRFPLSIITKRWGKR